MTYIETINTIYYIKNYRLFSGFLHVTMCSSYFLGMVKHLINCYSKIEKVILMYTNNNILSSFKMKKMKLERFLGG